MLMTPELFLDCILYIVNDNSDAARNLVLELIAFFENDVRNNASVDHDVTRSYIRILKAIITTKTTKQERDELRLLLLKFQSDPFLSKRNEIYTLLHDILLSEEIMSPGKINQSAEKIRNALAWHRCNKATRALYGTLARAGDMVHPTDRHGSLRGGLQHHIAVEFACRADRYVEQRLDEDRSPEASRTCREGHSTSRTPGSKSYAWLEKRICPRRGGCILCTSASL